MENGRSFFTSARLPIATVMLATGIFIADTVTRVDIAVPVLYVAVVLLSARFCRASGVTMVAAGCAALTILSYVITRNTGPALEGIVNALISLGAIAVITPLVLKNQSRELALRRSEKDFRDLLENIPAVAFSARPDGSNDFQSRAWFEYSGQRLEDSLGDGWLATVHPDDLKSGATKWAKDWAGSDPFENEIRYRSATGEYRWFLARVTPLRDESGKVVKWFGVVTDIEDRKQTEEALRRSEAVLRQSEEKYSSMVRSSPDAITLRSLPDRRYLEVNEGFAHLTGYTAEEVLGKTSAELNLWVEPEFHRTTLQMVETEGHFSGLEFRFRTKTGEIRYGRVSAARVVINGEQCMLSITHDITDRVRAESLRAGAKHILEMAAKGHSLDQILDALCRHVEEQAVGSLASIALLDGDRLRLGAAPSLPKAYTDAPDGAAIGPLAGFYATAANRGEQVIVEDIEADPSWAKYRDAALDYSLRACWSTPVFSSQGRVIATLAIFYREPRSPSPRDQELIEQITHLAGDVIEPNLIHEALRRSEAYLAEGQRLTHTGSWAYDPSTNKTTYWSEQLFRIFNLDPRQGLPTNEAFWERIHPDDRDRVNRGNQKALGEKAECTLDFRLLLPDGTLKHIHSLTHAVIGRSGEVVELVGTAVDVTERRQAEEAVRRSEAHLAEAQRLTHTGSWARGANSDVYWSEEMFRIWGFDLMQRPPDDDTVLQRVHPEDRDETRDSLVKATRERSGLDREYRILLPDGTVRHIHSVGRPILSASGELIEMVGTVVDVTERKRAQEEREKLRQLEANLAHMNRVSVMGEMSASLAHELKQPMAAAVMNAEVCLELLQRDQLDIQELSDATSAILRSVKRAAEIIDRLRSLSRKSNPERELVDVNQVIHEIGTLLQSEARMSSVAVCTELAEEAPRVAGDRVQLQQVVMNLMLNALESMKEKGGDLVVRSELAETGEVMISVSDTGVGLPEGKEERIFDAFFTTKSHGTGMGLAISRSIVESHGGRLSVRGNSGPGVTFYVELPQRIGHAA